MIYLKKEGLLAVGTIRSNCLQGCPWLSNKDLQKSERGASDYRVNNNSRIIIVKWLDNSVVQLTSNYVGIEPMDQIEKWDKTAGKRKNVDCPQIAKAYNKSIGGVNLADMLIALWRISVKTKRWYIKIFWNLVDIAKVNGWILYKRHRVQLSIPRKEEKTLLDFSCELAKSLIKGNKTVASSSTGRPTKKKNDVAKKGGKTAVAILCHDAPYNGVGHWPVANSNKSRCHKCQKYCLMVCEKCNTYLCFLEDRNCFKLFHT